MSRIHPLKALFATLVALTARESAGQNLVPNPGFEQYHSCPRFLGNLDDDLVGWGAPTQGSTDYFNRCSKDMGTPENFNGKQAAAEGDGYSGFYAYAPGDYREYLQARLSRPLVAGRQYRLRFSLSLAERSDFALHSIGVLFTRKPMRVATKKNLSRRHWFADSADPHHLEVAAPAYFTDTENWMHLDTVFTARGSERYLIIGNMRTNARTRVFKTGRRSNKGAYYYLDAVFLESYGESNGSGREVVAGEMPVDSLLVLPSLLFEFDAYRISETGQRALARIFRALQADAAHSLELFGHTDSVGTDPYNQYLSEQRCRAVADHLRKLGLEPHRVRWTALGATRPLADNATASGRQRNRRVEFIIHSGKPVPAPQK